MGKAIFIRELFSPLDVVRIIRGASVDGVEDASTPEDEILLIGTDIHTTKRTAIAGMNFKYKGQEYSLEYSVGLTVYDRKEES